MEKNNLKEEDFDQELHEHFAFKIDSGQEPIRIDKFLMSRIENATRNKIQKAAKDGSIRVNDKIVKSSYKVKKNDEIKILFTHPPYENLLTPEKIELDVVYEDDYIVIVNKKSGMVVHPGHGNYSGTLINDLLYHF
jgi:23S rRNA pseudouridine1911/1915/1917 synthase